MFKILILLLLSSNAWADQYSGSGVYQDNSAALYQSQMQAIEQNRQMQASQAIQQMQMQQQTQQLQQMQPQYQQIQLPIYQQRW